jgi:hypothetical protein
VTRPLLGLLVAPGTVERSAPLVRRLGRWCEPRALDITTPPVAAVLATGPAVPGLRAVLDDRPGPVAVWVDDERELAAGGAVVGSADVVVTRSAAVAGVVGQRVVVLPPEAIEADAVAPVPPFVRERWRRRAGLDPVLVVAVGVSGGTSLPDEAVPTALAVAAAAVVAGPSLVTALALGTPVVTDAASAARVGAGDGVEVEVADPADAPAVARRLAGDPVQAAALSRRARRLVERRFDLGPAAADLAARLGLDRVPSPAARLDAALAELGTPPGARPAVRAAEALAALPTFGRVVASPGHENAPKRAG